MNNKGLQDRGILDVVRLLSAQGASGRLQVSTGMTEGALFFARGQLVDARLGRLNGFQAINALVSVPDASYNFDPSIAPPATSSIAPNERLLLKDFFGIEVADNEHSSEAAPGWLEDDARAQQVAPLAEVAPEYADDRQLLSNDDEATLVRPEPFVAERRHESVIAERGPVVTERGPGVVEPGPRVPEPGPVVAEPVAERVLAEAPPAPVFAAPRHEPVFAEPRPPLASRPVARSWFVPALVLILLTVLMAAAAVALRNRFRNPESTASVAPTAQTSPAEVAQQPATHTTQQPETQKSAQTATQQTQQPAAEQTQQTQTAAAAVPDLNGTWKVINTVEQTAYEPYRNMEIGFNVAINQAGKEFTGTGEKISENGRSLPAAGRTAILVKGRIEGDRINATFSENGAVRKTNGRFVWRIDRGSGGLTGRFNSTAARTSGRSAAKKVL